MTATEAKLREKGEKGAEETGESAVSRGVSNGKAQLKGRTIRKCRTQKLIDPLQLLTLVVASNTADGVDLGKLGVNGREDGGIGTRAGPKFLCTICASTFGRRCELKRHIGEVHMINGARRFKCTHPSCVKSFTRKDALVKHNAVKHQGKRRFVCPTCSEKFTSRYDLSRHAVRVHSSVKKRFTCEFCNAGFSQKSQLTMHKGRVHSPQSQNSSMGMTSSTSGSISCESRVDSEATLGTSLNECKAFGIDSLATVAAALAAERDAKPEGTGCGARKARRCQKKELKKAEGAACYGAATLLTAAAVLQPDLNSADSYGGGMEDAGSKCTSESIGWGRSNCAGVSISSDCYSMDSDKA